MCAVRAIPTGTGATLSSEGTVIYEDLKSIFKRFLCEVATAAISSICARVLVTVSEVWLGNPQQGTEEMPTVLSAVCIYPLLRVCTAHSSYSDL